MAQARDLGLEPLVEAHDARELDAALASDARVIGINNRDLRTLDVDPERAVALRDAIPGDRLAIAESGVRDAATVARWRASGFDAALVGEALMRAGDPAATAAAFVAAGRDPVDLAADDRAPSVKVCGVTDARRGARRGPRRRGRHRPQLRARDAARADDRRGRPSCPPRARRRRTGPPGGRRRDRGPAAGGLAEVVAAVDPDAVQLSGDEPASSIAAAGRPVWKALRVGPGADPRRRRRRAPAATSRPARSGSCSTPPAARTRAAPGSASTRRSPPPSRARSRSRSPAA